MSLISFKITFYNVRECSITTRPKTEMNGYTYEGGGDRVTDSFSIKVMDLSRLHGA